MTTEELRDLREYIRGEFGEVKGTLGEINGRVREAEQACAAHKVQIEGLWHAVDSKAAKAVVGIMGGAIVALISLVLFKLYGVTL